MREQTSRPDKPFESWFTEEARQIKLALKPAKPDKNLKTAAIHHTLNLPQFFDRPDKKPM